MSELMDLATVVEEFTPPPPPRIVPRPDGSIEVWDGDPPHAHLYVPASLKTPTNMQILRSLLAFMCFTLIVVCWRVTHDLREREALQAQLNTARVQASADVADASAQGWLAGLAEAADIRRAAETTQKALEHDGGAEEHQDWGVFP
jgi:hypothetical protein